MKRVPLWGLQKDPKLASDDDDIIEWLVLEHYIEWEYKVPLQIILTFVGASVGDVVGLEVG